MSAMTAPAGANFKSKITGGDIVPKGHKIGQMQQFTPEQLNLFQQLFGHVGPQSYLARLASGSEEGFEPYAQTARREYGEALGQLGSRFSELSPGALSARKGSGFNLAANTAASQFAQDLAARRHELQRQAMGDLFSMSRELFSQSPYERFLIKEQPKGPSGWERFGAAALPIAGAAIGGLAGGPAGAQIGSTLGSAASRGIWG